MNFLNNDKGISEIIGALLVFLILVVVLGSIQVYEVPKWNKELERQNFDIVTAEFIEMKSDLEDVSSQFVPRTSALHMGVKYPERFMLRNPGPAYGTLSTYPLNITVNITLSDYSGGNITYNETKYTSNGIEYKLNGLSNFPKLVYEHGLIITDFDRANLTDTTQSLLIGDEIFIPIVNGSSITLSSAQTESLNLKPLEMSVFNTTNSTTGVEFNITRINITMDTKYNKTWNETFNDTNVRVEGNKIKISIPGSISSSRKYFVYPTEVPYQDSMYFGMLKFTSNPNALKGLKGEKGDTGTGSGTGTDGEDGANCYDSIGDYNNDGTANSQDCLDFIQNSAIFPPFTNIDPSMSNYPNIRGISIIKNTTISSSNPNWDITAMVYNVSKSQIYADLTDVTENIWMFKVNPDSYNSNVAKWLNLSIPNSQNHETITAIFWARNGTMQYFKQAVFYKKNNGEWT